MNKMTRTLLTLVGLMLLFPANSNADVVWTLTNDGNGNIRETISGTLDLSNGIDVGTTGTGGGFNLFQTDTWDLVQVHHYSSPSTGRSWFEVFDGYANNPTTQMVNMTASVDSHWQNNDHLLFQIFNNSNIFRAADFGGKFSTGPTAINEDLVHNVSMSVVNEGVWRYGNLDDNIEGNGVLFIIGNPSSVPEPSSFLLVAGAVGCTLLRRDRRRLA